MTSTNLRIMTEEELIKENEALKEKLKNYEELIHTNRSHDLYVAARNKMLVWVGAIAAVATLFGFVSVKALTSELRTSLFEGQKELIIKEISTDFIAAHGTQIVEEAREKIVEKFYEDNSGQFDSKVTAALDEQLLEIAAEYKEDSVAPNFATSIEDQIANGRYLVIAGSSPNKYELQIDLSKVERKVGDQFTFIDSFPNVKVRESEKRSGYYLLVIAEGLTKEDANKMKKRAAQNGFRYDTFISKVKKESSPKP